MAIAVKFNPESEEDRKTTKRIIKWFDENMESVPSVSSATTQSNLEPPSNVPVIKNPAEPATEAQIGVMRKFHIPFDEGISKGEASELIRKSKEGN